MYYVGTAGTVGGGRMDGLKRLYAIHFFFVIITVTERVIDCENSPRKTFGRLFVLLDSTAHKGRPTEKILLEFYRKLIINATVVTCTALHEYRRVKYLQEKPLLARKGLYILQSHVLKYNEIS